MQDKMGEMILKKIDLHQKIEELISKIKEELGDSPVYHS